jgi:very-short-patch-repair endonuclease
MELVDYIVIKLSDNKNIDMVKTNNNLWISQKSMAKILDKTTQDICQHLKDLHKHIGNVNNKKIFSIQQKEGNRNVLRQIKHYDIETFFNLATKIKNVSIVKEFLDIIKTFHPVKFRFSTKEYIFKDILDKTFKGVEEFIYQYKINDYIIDFYFPHIHLAIEYDEKHHNYYVNKNADIKRQNILEHDLGCKFIRVKEGCEFEGLNKILKHISIY